MPKANFWPEKDDNLENKCNNGWTDGIINGVRQEETHYRCPSASVLLSLAPSRGPQVEAFFFFQFKCQVLFWAPGLFTASLSQADLHELSEIARDFTCSTPELPPLNGLLEPEAVIVPCTTIKGTIMV